MRRWDELIGAATLLTRFPVTGLAQFFPGTRACLWAYPVVGLLVGGLAVAVHAVALGAHLPRTEAAILAVAVTALATGALHEDGLADTADGFGGGATVARKLEIMRDSRIGSYGALALLTVSALRVAAVASATHPGWALLLAGVLGRGAMLASLLAIGPARSDGLAAGLSGPGRIAGAGLAMAVAAGLLAPAALAAAALTTAAMTWLAQRQVGGYTGDTLGATEQLAECAVLLTF